MDSVIYVRLDFGSGDFFAHWEGGKTNLTKPKRSRIGFKAADNCGEQYCAGCLACFFVAFTLPKQTLSIFLVDTKDRTGPIDLKMA